MSITRAGYLSQVTNGASTVYWQATSVSATGKVMGETLGNGLTQTRSYDELDRLTGNAVGALQSFGYTRSTDIPRPQRRKSRPCRSNATFNTDKAATTASTSPREKGNTDCFPAPRSR